MCRQVNTGNLDTLPSNENDGSDFLVTVVNKRDWLTLGYAIERYTKGKEREMRREAMGEDDGSSGRKRKSFTKTWFRSAMDDSEPLSHKMSPSPSEPLH